jgi:hypothetical protein
MRTRHKYKINFFINIYFTINNKINIKQRYYSLEQKYIYKIYFMYKKI